MKHSLSTVPGPLPSWRHPARVLALGALAVLTCSAAAAQSTPRNLLGVGAISVAEFEGSADQAVRPLLIGRLDLGRYGSLRLAGLSVQHNLMSDDSRWAFGPVLSMRAARDEDVEDAVVRRLREVDGTAEFGAFVEYGFRDTLSQGDRLSVGAEAKGGKGNQLALTASYQGAKRGAFQYSVDARAVWANDKYMDRYFSVDADNSTRSGLPTYVASGGLKSMGLGFTGTYDLNRQWSLIGRLGVTRLVGDASDSPIVQLRGDTNAASVGLAIGYRF